MFVALVDPVRRSQSTLIILPSAQPSQAHHDHLRCDRPTAMRLLGPRLKGPKRLTRRFPTAPRTHVVAQTHSWPIAASSSHSHRSSSCVRLFRFQLVNRAPHANASVTSTVHTEAGQGRILPSRRTPPRPILDVRVPLLDERAVVSCNAAY